MSRHIPTVGRYLVNFWKDGRAIASAKVEAPTRVLAWLNLVHDQPQYLRHKFEADRITVTRMKRVPR
jgi:hypothetical protein